MDNCFSFLLSSLHDFSELFKNDSHDMEVLVVLNHSWSPLLKFTCLYWRNELLWVLVGPSGVFSWEKTLCPQIDSFKRTHLGLDTFTELFLSNIIKYGKNDIEWQTSIQGYKFEWFLGLFEEREGSFKASLEMYSFSCDHEWLCEKKDATILKWF